MLHGVFENGVVLEVTKTSNLPTTAPLSFENGVVLEVTKTSTSCIALIILFENGVVLEVTKTLYATRYPAW